MAEVTDASFLSSCAYRSGITSPTNTSMCSTASSGNWTLIMTCLLTPVTSHGIQNMVRPWVDLWRGRGGWRGEGGWGRYFIFVGEKIWYEAMF